MRMHARIQKWGNGLALRVGGAMRDIPHFKEGTEVDIEITEQGFTVKKSSENKKLFPFSESMLVEGLTSESAHADLLAAPLANEIEP
jgi:antitoxin MazE